MRITSKINTNKDELFACSIKTLKSFFADQMISIMMGREVLSIAHGRKLPKKLQEIRVCMLIISKEDGEYFTREHRMLLSMETIKKEYYTDQLKEEFEKKILPYLRCKCEEFSQKPDKKYSIKVQIKDGKFVLSEEESV